jgi:hemerythrin
MSAHQQLWAATHTLASADIDGDHREFAKRLNLLLSSSDTDFPTQFQELISHTREHFLKEGNLMREAKYQERDMHESEHQRVLTELQELNRGIRRGRLGLVRAHVKEGLSEWFTTHMSKMDNPLLAHLKTQ